MAPEEIKWPLESFLFVLVIVLVLDCSRTTKGKIKMNADVIKQTIQLWVDKPQEAKVSPVVKARNDGAQAVVETGPFSWRMDLPSPLGGENKAANPTAMLLGALAGCAVVFIRDTIAPQLGLRVDSVHAEVNCKTDLRGLLGMQEAVPDLQDIEISIQIESPEPEDKVRQIYRTWRERCPVYLALTKPLSVNTVFTTAEVRS